MELKFRLLRADEIDCRVATVKENGLSILLFKDARCDQNILDETVGCMNWQRHHLRDNANCIVSIWDNEKKQWIEKEDTGTESNTEKEKGLASDSFKRACFNWGLGRELYTAPFMWVSAKDCHIVQKGQGYTCYDRFTVEDIQYKDRQITYVRIRNRSTNAAIEFGAPSAPAIGETKAKALETMLGQKGVSVDVIYSQYGVKKLSELDEIQHAQIIKRLEKSSGNNR